MPIIFSTPKNCHPMRVPFSFFVFVFFCLGSAVQAQSLLYCQYGDELLPVESVRGSVPMCFTGDSLVKGKQKDQVMFPAEQFGEGFIEIEIVKNKRGGVFNNGGVLQFESPRGWYLLVCRLIADRDIPDCYFTIGFDQYGEKSCYSRSLGDLKEGETKSLRVYLKLGYEMPDQLHVFSGMDEIRTSLLPTEYQYEEGELVFASK